MNAKLRILLSSVALGAVMIANTANAVTLEDSVRMAVSTNPEVGVAVREHEAMGYDVRAAEAGYYPSVNLNAQYGPEWTDSATTRARVAPRDRDPTMPRSVVTLSLTQMLFDGWATTSNVERQEARQDSAAFRVREASEFVGLDAVESYLEVLRRTKLVDLAQQNVAVHEEYLGMVNSRMTGGRGNVADVRQAESRLGTAKATLTESQGNLRDAQSTFLRVVGAPADTLDFPSFPYDMFPEDVDHAVALSLLNNPTVNIATSDVAVYQGDLDISQAAYYPEFNLELSTSHRKNNDGVRGTDREALGLVTMNWNLYRGGGDVAREGAAVLRRERAKENLNRTKREAEESTRISWNAFVTSKARSADLKEVVDANQRVRDAYLSQFDIGQRSLLDLLDSENEYFVASGSLITAEFTTLLGAYRVMAETGSLLGALGVAGPEQQRQASAQ